MGDLKLDCFLNLPHTPKVTNVASQHFCLLIPILTFFVALFSWKNQLLLKQARRHESKDKSSKKHKSDEHNDKEHSSDKGRERLNSSENGEDRHKRKERKSSRGRSHTRSRSRER